jgi:hypothetical protein
MSTVFAINEVAVVPPATLRHRLAGTVEVDSVPARKRVVALDRLTLEAIAGTWSDAVTGAWEMQWMRELPVGRLLIIAFDDAGTYNAEVADYVSQVVTEV